VAENLNRFTPTSLPDLPDVARRAAVVVCLLEREGAPQVLLLKRSSRGRNPGQWALPGGRLEPGEPALQGGLRELREETGLVATNEDVLGRLDDFRTTSGFVISPVVVVSPPQDPPQRAPAEVHSLHPIPIAALTATGVPRWAQTSDGRRLLQMPLRPGMVVHAPTGAILWQFAEVGLRGRATRVEGLAEPDFTAR
jgi:8-oxo-dGTP pyrophosphatase MutT (NUDIX family)